MGTDLSLLSWGARLKFLHRTLCRVMCVLTVLSTFTSFVPIFYQLFIQSYVHIGLESLKVHLNYTAFCLIFFLRGRLVQYSWSCRGICVTRLEVLLL